MYKSIKQFCKDDFSFSLQFVERGIILNEIRSLNATKSAQKSDISTKLIKENEQLIVEFLHAALNKRFQ